MEWLEDSRACLAVAETMLVEIEGMIQQSIRDESVTPYIKVKIKNCLENCRSPLDYVANYVFDHYCIMEYTAKELKKFKVYYPISPSEHIFNIAIKEKYKSLTTKRSDIVKVFEDSQSFKGDIWLKHLPKLINENKHRNLTQQSKEQTTTIHSGQIGGMTFNNVSMINVKTPFMIGNMPINFIDPSPYDHLFDASVKLEYYFQDIGLSVIPTLKAIHHGATIVINEMERII